MAGVFHITINGELGSGKSSVARRLADLYAIRLVSTGDVQRSIARELQLSTLETNLRAEADSMIDARVDQVSRNLASSSEPILFDSRMAWHFVPKSYKIHLLVDPAIAAHRMHNRVSAMEEYQSAEDARALAEQRYLSERRRFIATYGVDIFRLKNYDLVVDTSAATIDEVVDVIRTELDAADGSAPGPAVYVSPRRIIPGYDITAKDHAGRSGPPQGPPSVGYSRPFFFLLSRHGAIEQALRRNEPLVDVHLAAEGADTVADDLSANDYLHHVIQLDWLESWEDAHGFRFSRYPTPVVG